MVRFVCDELNCSGYEILKQVQDNLKNNNCKINMENKCFVKITHCVDINSDGDVDGFDYSNLGYLPCSDGVKESDGDKVFYELEDDGTVVFSNIYFTAGEEFGKAYVITDKGIINIQGKAEFNNCVFAGFYDELMPIIKCSGNSFVTFKNCVFFDFYSAVHGCDNAHGEFINCKFNNIKDTCLYFKDNSVCNLKKCKGFVNSGNVLGMEGNTSGSMELCNFKGAWVQKTKDKDNKAAGEDVFPVEDIKQQEQISLLDIGTTKKFNIYKSSFKGFMQVVSCGDDSKINLIECKVSDNYQDFGVINKADLSIYSSVISGGTGVFIFGAQDSSISVYDSEFKKCKTDGIYVQDNCKLKVFDSNIYSNKGHGIVHCDLSDVTVRECSIYGNLGAAIYSDGDSTGNISYSKIYDNNLFNVLLFGKANINFDHNDFFYNKASCFDFHISNIACHEEAKGYFENNSFRAFSKSIGGFYTKDQGEIFSRNCSFNTIDYLATLEGKSQVYVTDCDLKNLDDCIVLGEKGTKCSIVGCGGTYKIS